MQVYDEKLRDLAEKMHEKKSVEAKLQAARAQCDTLQTKADALRKTYLREQADVDTIEGHGVVALFYAAIGKKEEKREKERAEAYAAKAKYDAAAYALAAAQGDIAFFEQKLKELRACEAEYKACLAEKAAQIQAENGDAARALLALDETIAQAKHQQKEVREAMAAGTEALATVAEILKHLSDAEGFGAWDIMGGGLLADIAKHEELDGAQRLVERLQSELRRFQTELVDVNINGALQLKVEGFLSVADFIFDGLFVDWMVLDSIDKAKTQVNQTQSEIEQVMRQLNVCQTQAQSDLERAQRARDTLIVSA